MNEIKIYENSGIFVDKMDLLSASIPFYHVDRIAKTNVLIYVLSGCIYVSEEGLDYEIHEGELLLLKEGTHQYGTRMIEAGTSWIYAHFVIDTIDTLSDDNSLKYIELPKMVTALEKTDIPKRLDNIIRDAQKMETLNRNRQSLRLQELLLDIYELKVVSKDTSLPERIVRFLRNNLYENLKAEDLEKYFHLTYKYLARVFKDSMGMGIMQYHNNLRMEEAARILRATTKSVAEVSEELGFIDPLYFSKCFRKYAGTSPREYRKMETIF